MDKDEVKKVLKVNNKLKNVLDKIKVQFAEDDDE